MNEETMNPVQTGMFVNNSMKADLLSAAKWAKFLCIVGCIGVALMLIAAIALVALGSKLGGAFPGSAIGGAGMGLLYLIIVAIYIYPLIKGFQFANATKTACLYNNESELARGFEGLNSLMRYFGILTIIILSIYVLVIIGFIFAAIFYGLGNL